MDHVSGRRSRAFRQGGLQAGFALLAWLSVDVAHAIDLPMEFPTDAQTLTDESFRDQIVGQVFVGRTASNQEWRMEFREGGLMYWNVDQGSDEGEWTFQNTELCIKMRRTRSTCNPVRVKGDQFFYQRLSNHEVVRLQRQ